MENSIRQFIGRIGGGMPSAPPSVSVETAKHNGRVFKLLSAISDKLTSLIQTMAKKIFPDEKASAPTSPPATQAAPPSYNAAMAGRNLADYDMRQRRESSQSLAAMGAAGQLINFGLKKAMSTDNKSLQQEEALHEKHDGQHVTTGLRQKRNYAENFMEEHPTLVDDSKGMERIVKHRKIMEDVNIDKGQPNAASRLCRRVQELSNPGSENVVHFDNGGSCFSIPTGCEGHYVTHEIRRVPVGNGEFKHYYVIHNRGYGKKDQLHGGLELRDEKGVRYMKTTVAIEVSPEMLNEQFFQDLLKAENEPKITPSYDCIRSHLIDKGGKVYESPNELKLKSTMKQIETETKAHAELGKAQQRISFTLRSLERSSPDKARLMGEIEKTRGSMAAARKDLADPQKRAQAEAYIQQATPYLQGIEAQWGRICESEKLPYQFLREDIAKLRENPILKSNVDLQMNLIQIEADLNAGKDISPQQLRGLLGHIQQVGSEGQQQLHRLQQEKVRLEKELIDEDEGFNSTQVFGTCTESNRTGPEKQMASKSTRQRLKLYTIKAMTEGVRTDAALGSEERDLLVGLGQQKQAQMQQKLQQRS